MAAGFIIPRILLLCLIKEVTCASSLQAANARYKMQLDRGPNQDAHGFRRPLHYVRSLRLPKINPESLNKPGKGQTSQRTLLKDLSIGLTPRQSVAHRWSQASPIQPSPQRIDPLPRPRGFEVSLDFPFLSPHQMKTSGSRVEDLTDSKLKSKSSVYFTVPQFGKKNDDGSASGLHVNLTFTPAVLMKPLKISCPDEKPKDPKNVPLTSYGEPGKWLSTIQTGLKWPSLSQTTAEETKKHGSTWSYPDTGSKQTLHQPYVSIYTRPNQGKLASNIEPLNYKSPQIKLEKPLSQDVGPQRPDSTNPPSLSIVKYIENLDFFKNPISPTRKDNQIDPPSVQKQYLSPLQYNAGSQGLERGGSPSIQFQRGSITSAANIVRDVTNYKNEKDRKAEYPSLHIEFSFPPKTVLPNVTKSNDYLNINPQNFASLFNQNTGSTKRQSNLPQTELKRPFLELDDAENKRTEPQGRLSNLNLEKRPQLKKWFTLTVPSKPKDVKPNFSSWLQSRQVVPAAATREQQVEDKKSNFFKPQLPKLIYSKPLSVGSSRPLERDESTSIQPKPSRAEGIQSSHSSQKPSISNNGKGNARPTDNVSPASTVYRNPFQPSSDLMPNVETLSVPHYPPLAFGLSAFNSLKSDASPVEQPQEWNKQVYGPHLYWHNSVREAPFVNVQTPHNMPTWYQTQNKLPKENHGANQDVRIDTDGSGAVFGQAFQNKWTGKDTVEVPFNVQPLCGSASSTPGHKDDFTDSTYFYQSARPQPCKQMPCQPPISRCQNEPKRQSPNVPQKFNSLQKAEATSISLPSSTFQVLSQSTYNPDQNAFMLWQYPVGQRHPRQLTRSK